MLLFGDFMTFGAAREQRIYEELTEIAKVKSILEVCYYLIIIITYIQRWSEINTFFFFFFVFIYSINSKWQLNKKVIGNIDIHL